MQKLVLLRRQRRGIQDILVIDEVLGHAFEELFIVLSATPISSRAAVDLVWCFP